MPAQGVIPSSEAWEQVREVVRSHRTTSTMPHDRRRRYPLPIGGGGGGTIITGTSLRAVRIVEVHETDPILGPHLIVRLQQENPPDGSGAPLTWSDAIRTTWNVTVGGSITNQTFRISLQSSVIAQFTASGHTADQVRDALIASWNSSPFTTDVTASNGGAGIVTLTADLDELDFEPLLNTPGGGATFTRQQTSNLLAYADFKHREAIDADPENTLAKMFEVNRKYWMTVMGGYNVVLSTPVGLTGTIQVIQQANFDSNGCLQSFTAITLRVCNGQILEAL